MDTAAQIMNKAAIETGWNYESMLNRCLQYIEAQKDNATFKSFLDKVVEEELEAGEDDG